MFAIIKKELKSYFFTPIGYIFIGLFMLLFSVFFYLQIYSARSTNYEYLFYNGATLLTFLTPLLTMRMFSEERKQGTDQLLLTSPRSVTAIVIGKFLAAVFMILITEACTLIYYGILKYFGNPSYVLAISTLIGFSLLGIAYVSLGMFVSSITESQIVAALITIAILLCVWFIPTRDGLFSLIDGFESFIDGLIDSTGIILYGSFTLMFILLTIIVLQRRKNVK